MIRSHLPEAHLSGRRVFLRADLSVPVIQGSIIDDFRLKAIEPTLKLLVEKGTKIILTTHRGRPKEYDANLSTKVLMPWFEKRGYKIEWESDLEKAYERSLQLSPGSILLLENLRFYKAEQDPDEEFAQRLRQLGDYYINDAFALLHRKDTSITLLPALYEPQDKTIGLLIEKELAELSKLTTPTRPFLIILGGGKVHDKLPFIEKLLDKADSIIVLPALAFTFLKALGTQVGLSLVDTEALPHIQGILDKAREKNVTIILPVDYLVALDSLQGPLIETDTIPQNGLGIAVGSKSLSQYERVIDQAETIFFNGAMGLLERPDTLWPLEELLRAIAQSNTLSVIGGGESVAAVHKYHLESLISFCSTGGGASLYYLSYGNFPSLEYVS